MRARAHTRTHVRTHAQEHACERACARACTCTHSLSPAAPFPSYKLLVLSPVGAKSCGARGRGGARAAVRGCVVGQPVASLGPAWAVLDSLCYKLPCLPGGTCAARLDTGAGVSAWGVLGGQLASGASQGSRRCAMSMLLCYAAALAASAARATFMLSYQKEDLS